MIAPLPGIAGLMATERSGLMKPSVLDDVNLVQLWSMLPPTVKRFSCAKTLASLVACSEAPAVSVSVLVLSIVMPWASQK